jgi:hypothetical protein
MRNSPQTLQTTSESKCLRWISHEGVVLLLSDVAWSVWGEFLIKVFFYFLMLPEVLEVNFSLFILKPYTCLWNCHKFVRKRIDYFSIYTTLRNPWYNSYKAKTYCMSTLKILSCCLSATSENKRTPLWEIHLKHFRQHQKVKEQHLHEIFTSNTTGNIRK